MKPAIKIIIDFVIRTTVIIKFHFYVVYIIILGALSKYYNIITLKVDVCSMNVP